MILIVYATSVSKKGYGCTKIYMNITLKRQIKQTCQSE